MNKHQVISAIFSEASEIHHNASTLGINFEADDKYGQEFETFLACEADALCRRIEARIEKHTGRKYTICQHGRSGATIAPDEWYVDTMTQKGINTGELMYGLSGLDYYNEARHIYYVLRTINQMTAKAKSKLKKRWAQQLHWFRVADLPAVKEIYGRQV